MPSPRLAPYISTYYLTEVVVPEGEEIADRLHPEWANLRFSRDANWRAAIGDKPLCAAPQMIATGPTSLSAQFTTGSMRAWGVGLMPLGWSRFVDAPAEHYVDRFCDGQGDPAFAAIAPLLDGLFGAEPDAPTEAARIDAHMLSLLERPAADEDKIIAANAALIDHDISTVTALAERLAMSSRTLERFSRRVFGFSPKLLLRRQRFLRSLGQFMLDPSMTWLSTLDWHYHDQAHFVRDFKRFMCLSPSAYGAMDHPVMRAAARARTAMMGAPVQALHQPHRAS